MYLDKILKRFSMEKSKKGEFLIHSTIMLIKTHSPSADEEITGMSRVPYASAVGSTMYVMTSTRPYMYYALSMVIRFQGNHGRSH